MKIFSIILGDIPKDNSDLFFISFIEHNKLEWWRYTALNYFLTTPDNYNVRDIHEKVMEAYPGVISAVFEITIKDWKGIGPTIYDNGKEVSFLFWFEKITNSEYVPAWERDPIIGRKYHKPSEHLILTNDTKPAGEEYIGQTNL